MNASSVRGRYAPSPTGDLHLGNVRTALLAWLFARQAGGTFVLRVEDLDRPRVRPGAAAQMLEDLRWLGLDWDEGPDCGGPFAPYLQSERQATYDAYLAKLRTADLVYPCYCSRAEVARAASAPQGAGDDGPRYPGTCRNLSAAERKAREAEGRRPCVRFRAPDRLLAFVDLVAGPVAQNVAQAVGDFIVSRSDGIPAYQLAVVVDDGLMQTTQVVRGADLLSSTARQIALFEALGFAVPSFGHVPLVVDAQGARLAKRERAAGVGALRSAGIPAERVIGALAASCGLCQPGETMNARELLASCELERLRSVAAGPVEIG
ncbi:MAG TPA: tRNA glutamyl-Q(34) synthetase GluQRS [Ktedonobacterales bacterium]|nr:tRNA glutamyl-Q(34) synthetase GluQRS [Ktedonobacterales bacterium]